MSRIVRTRDVGMMRSDSKALRGGRMTCSSADTVETHPSALQLTLDIVTTLLEVRNLTRYLGEVILEC